MSSFEIDTLPSIHRSAWELTRPRREITLLRDEELRNRRDIALEPAPGYVGRQFSDMQDQMRFLKDELMKKDKLISQLTSFETPRPKTIDQTKLDDLSITENTAALANARSELAGAQLRADGLQSQLREVQAQLEVREDKLKELRTQLECAHETEVRMNVTIQSLRNKLVEFESHLATMEGRTSRSDLVVQTLQQENREANDRLIELETKLRILMEEKGEMSEKHIITERKLTETFSKFATLLGTQDCTPDSLYTLIAKLTEERNTLISKLSQTKENIALNEHEVNTYKDTINKLTAELESERGLFVKANQDVNILKQDKEELLSKQRSLQREIDTVRNQLEFTQRSWNESKRELQEMTDRQQQQLGGNESLRRNFESLQSVHRQLLESLATLLGVDSRDEVILERVRRIAASQRENVLHISSLEKKIEELSKQLEDEKREKKHVQQLTLRSQEEINAAEQKLALMKTKLVVNSEQRERELIQIERNRCSTYLERISKALQLNPANDQNIDKLCEMIVEKVVQITQDDGQLEKEHKSHVKQLQQKIKAAKDQLQSRDLHMDLLRKKIATLEERLIGQSGLEHEKNEEFVKNRKLLKLVEKYKNELAEAREEIRDLKARLLESSDCKIRMLEREKDIDQLQHRVVDLEVVREEQARKITNLLSNVEDVNREFTDKREVANNTISALTSELRTTRTALDETQKREQQLLDLRRVLARMLGLDVNILAVPDFEIISRLEQLIMASQSNASAALTMDAVLADMESGFRRGYDEAAHMMRAFERSASPQRRINHSKSPSKIMTAD